MSKQEGCVLGFDFGTRSIGVAVGQSVTGTASPLAALAAKDGIPDWFQLEKLLQTWQPELCVIGLPLNMDGSEQPLTVRSRKFGNRLHGRFGVAISFQDERLTTVSAKETLFSQGGFKNLSKEKIDSASACLILEDYFTYR
ncbi:Holliday junction resolvase RuvX [Aliidiomarina minuta]|uniref:Putative pre-16S rRNA nuclease n=1 Tax=Aliidiomarina minuta TaxID=880057 RepID=A0A432W482_9GAMM|nr:Holliday junction resolvase RuvX [Aliidiomarina minuta]RUO24313.1 Holliday junction resolvase RuvX [Aliidiomarina minuta]